MVADPFETPRSLAMPTPEERAQKSMTSWSKTRYTSSEEFERESRRIFERTWMCVAHVSELPSPGSFIRTQIGLEDVLIVRNRDGVVRGLLNLCQHRGTLLCKDEQGNFGRSIRCMYHGWTYDLDGKLVGVPLRRELPAGVEERHLRTVAVEEWLGYIWVNLAADAPPFADYIATQIEARFGRQFNPIPQYDMDHLQVVRTIRYDVKTNWKLLWENFHECYHCPAMHPELCSAIPYFRQGYGTVTSPEALAKGLGTKLADGMEGFSLSGKPTAPPLPSLPAEEQRMFYGFYAQPSVSVSFVPEHVFFMRIQPLGPSHTRVVSDWLYHPDAIAQEDFDPEDAIKVFDITNIQDFEACERMQMGTRSQYYDESQIHSPHEYLISEFRRKVDEALMSGGG